MKTLFSKIIIISLSLSVFGCGGPTIDRSSDEYDYISKSGKITTYKGEPFTGILTKTHENGQLKWKTSYVEGKKDGSYEEYYENGQLEMKTSYKGGDYDGSYERYYENGQLKEKRSYKGGKIVGGTEYYDENGQPK